MKTINRQVDSDYQYLYASSTGLFSSDARNPADFLNYKQNISLTYVLYTYSTKNKYTFKVGTRYEHTDSIGLAGENFFGGMKMTSTLESPTFSQTSVNNIHNQNLKLTFSYKIGNMKFVEKKSKSVKNDDVKGGESNN